MKETVNKQYTFVHKDFSVWFDLTEHVKRYQNYSIRDSFGGNDAIHKLKKHEETDIQ